MQDQIQSWDCPFKDLATSDFVVGQVWGRVGPHFLLLRSDARMDGRPATVRAVRQLFYKPTDRL